MDKIYLLIITTGFIFGACTKPKLKLSNPPQMAQFVDQHVEISKKITIDPNQALSLKNAFIYTLKDNPSLKSFSWNLRAKEAAILQAKLPPNPELSVDMEDSLGSGIYRGAKNMQLSFVISQAIEIGGKRGARIKQARALADIALWDFELKKLTLYGEVASRFIDVIVAQENYKRIVQLEKLTKQMIEAIDHRLKAGKISQLTADRAQNMAALVEINLERAKRSLEARRIILSSLWGCQKPCFSQAIGFLKLSSYPSFQQLQVKLDQNPKLLRWANLIRLEQAKLAIKKSKAFGNLNISAGYRYFNSTEDSAFLFGLSMPLPLFNRNQGAIEEAEANVKKSRADRNVAKRKITERIARLYNDMVINHNQAKLLQEKLVPNAEKTFSKIKESFSLGRSTFMDLLDSQRTLYSIKGRLLDSLSQYHKRKIELEVLIGEQLNKVN